LNIREGYRAWADQQCGKTESGKNFSIAVARCDKPSEGTFRRRSIRRSRLFTTSDKKLSTQAQICDYFEMDVYIWGGMEQEHIVVLLMFV